jgi:outer membrane protein assembly factor BamB
MVYAVMPSAPGSAPKLVWSDRIAHSGFLGAGGIFEPPTYSQGIVVVAGGPTLDGACSSGSLNAFQADTGVALWRVCTPTEVIGSAAATGDLLFVPMANQLVAYNIFTGRLVWRAQQNGQTWGGVAISRGYVVSGTLSKLLYCYTLPPVLQPHMR